MYVSIGRLADEIVRRGRQPGLAGRLALLAASQPEPFTVMPISYNNAFGGVDPTHEDPAKHRWYPTNHAGVGYHERHQSIDGKSLPNTEETGRKVKDPEASTGRWRSARSAAPGNPYSLGGDLRPEWKESGSLLARRLR